MDEKAIYNKGKGLNNIKERLSQLYGTNHSLKISNAVGGGFVVSITFPFER